MPASRRLWLALEIGLAASASANTTTLRAHAPGPLESYGVIAARDLFNPLPDGDRRLTDGLRLWGVGLHGARGHAVIEDVEAHRQELYRVGDTIRGARITAIAWDRVTVERDGIDATLELAPPGESRAIDPATTTAAAAPSAPERIRRTGADAFIVDRRELEGATSTMSGLMTQLRAVVEMADGRPAGFRLFQIKEDSVFRRLGIQDGDVVQRVNGTPVSDPASLLAFLERLRSEPRVAVDIVRGGTARTLVYDLR